MRGVGRLPGLPSALVLSVLAAACGHGSGGSPTAASAAPQGRADARLQSQYVHTVAAVSPSVVLVRTDKGLGSGVVFDSHGDVVTNDHVVAGASTLQVATSAGRRAPATVVGTFAEDDLAVVHTAAPGLRPASFADSSKLAVGDIVMAVGNPLGLASSVTQGIVSALGRTVVEPSGVPIPDAIQTSAAINPGNSGGALVNLSGQVVGIPTLAATDPQIGGTAPGIGFAIPSDTVTGIAGQLVRYGHVINSHRAYLGVGLASLPSGGGAVVASVTAGGPAAAAGIAPGDVIVEVAGHRTPGAEALAAVLASLAPGATVPIRVVATTGGSRTVHVRLGKYPG